MICLSEVTNGTSRFCASATNSQSYAEHFDESINFVDSSYLVYDNLTFLALECTRNPGWIISPLGGHWRNDRCRYVSIHFIRRDNQAWTAFFDFVTNGWIKVYQIDIESFYFHCHSSLSQEVRPIVSLSSSLSSPLSAMIRNFRLQS